MTAEELIIAHFEGTLSLEQEGELTRVLAASPEARAMYDRYLRVDDVLAGDVVATAPSSALDERVLAAALGAIGGTIGGGSAAGWLSGKVAAAISVVAVGGLSVLLLTLNDSDPVRTETPAATPAKPVPSVAPAPVPSTPAPAAVETEPAGETAVTPADRSRENVERPTTRRPTASTPAGTRPSARRPDGSTATNTNAKPKLDLPTKGETTIQGETRVDPDKQK